MSSATSLEELLMPSAPVPPGYISKLPEKIISIPLNIAADAVKTVAEIGEKGTATYKNYEEAKAARCQAAVFKTVDKRLPGLLDDTQELLQSGKERNDAIACSAKHMAARYEKLVSAQVNCADTVQQSARGINAAVSS
ncbi:hypothetical protein TGAMA5MH_08465 [Trichoderma gamsii]|uniref:Uncharacterized protein n=1 Tax=Trichoderma gamsii TaxID=398673 RepID=A0A2K0T292_9HYPO|nr:hypothetical protein TGAMA5MH_08465 [Trichoderma gamsii]